MDNNRLDLNRCSPEGIIRLIDAILKQTIRDWNISANIINKKGIIDKEMYELKRIIDFILSDHFLSLTNSNCPQIDCVNQLILKITNTKAREELNNYVLINSNNVINKLEVKSNLVTTR